jgi:hypothetical protein
LTVNKAFGVPQLQSEVLVDVVGQLEMAFATLTVNVVPVNWATTSAGPCEPSEVPTLVKKVTDVGLKLEVRLLDLLLSVYTP